ncbi:cAMP-inducible prespore protein D7-like isoform X2 [Vespa velutina]|uniref:cAMP-inducible prespore protein D7-like isoform X2 n=1 Tax=Vespa velutina TaxID=202808 RepID=UPI001FB2910C|nr:cAMP-inducible prespore protein D7-like isoform X2 [Vespa velutina]
MENECASLSEIQTDRSFSSRTSVNDSENRNESSEDYENEHNQKVQDDLNLNIDLQNVETTEKSDILYDNTYEKLSAVLEQSENSLSMNKNYEEFDDNENEESKYIDRALRERINSLNELMMYLREELKKEVTLWRKEREEFQLLREQSDIFALEEATAAARAAAAAYAAESPLSNDIDYIIDVTSEKALTELTILEYEKKLAKYQDTLALAQAEKRYNMHRQVVAKAYARRLAEIEQLCNEELKKIQQNASNLQPLREMMSQWYTVNRNHGDTAQEYNFNVAENKNNAACTITEYSNFHLINAEANMIPEILVTRFNNDDLSKGDKS